MKDDWFLPDYSHFSSGHEEVNFVKILLNPYKPKIAPAPITLRINH